MSDLADATALTPLPTDVVGLGLNAMDYIAIVPTFPRPDSKVEMREVRLQPGGQVATALVICRRLGLDVRYIGSVGDDDLGRAQLESLRSEGVGTESVRVVPGATTQLALSLIEENLGERSILWHRDPRLTYPSSEVSRDLIVSARLLHLDGRDTGAALASARFAREAGVPIVIDIDKCYDATTLDLLALVDYMIAAEEFALELTGTARVDDAALALSERFSQALVGVTMGSRGAVFIQEGRAVRSPAFRVEVRDTTGAGDVFHGAFIYGVLNSWDLARTVRFAHGAAAIKCTQLGARGGPASLGEVEDFLATAVERTE